MVTKTKIHDFIFHVFPSWGWEKKKKRNALRALKCYSIKNSDDRNQHRGGTTLFPVGVELLYNSRIWQISLYCTSFTALSSLALVPTPTCFLQPSELLLLGPNEFHAPPQPPSELSVLHTHGRGSPWKWDSAGHEISRWQLHLRNPGYGEFSQLLEQHKDPARKPAEVPWRTTSVRLTTWCWVSIGHSSLQRALIQ